MLIKCLALEKSGQYQRPHKLGLNSSPERDPVEQVRAAPPRISQSLPLVPAHLPVPSVPTGPHSSSLPPGLPGHLWFSLSLLLAEAGAVTSHPPGQHCPVSKHTENFIVIGEVICVRVCLCMCEACGGQKTTLVMFHLVFETEPFSGPELGGHCTGCFPMSGITVVCTTPSFPPMDSGDQTWVFMLMW